MAKAARKVAAKAKKRAAAKKPRRGSRKSQSAAKNAAPPAPDIKVTKPQRVIRAIELVVEHGSWRRGRVVEALIEEFGISTRTADEDLAEARKLLKSSAAEYADEQVPRIAEAAWAQFRKAAQKGNFKATADHLNILARLFGKTKLDLSGDIKTTGVLIVPGPRAVQG